MQWAKIYDDDPRKAILADKYAVRAWIREQIGEEYLTLLLGVWKHVRDIDFDALPESFVLKTTHDYNSTVLVPHKSELTAAEKRRIRHRFSIALRTDFGAKFCELHYSAISPGIIATGFIGKEDEAIIDYKFPCFYGEPLCCWVRTFQSRNYQGYSLEWKRYEYPEIDFHYDDPPLPKPKNYDRMIEIVRKLSHGFDQVRVDLYNLNGVIYFGEMTFTSSAGYEFQSYESDIGVGMYWHADTSKRTSAYIRS